MYSHIHSKCLFHEQLTINKKTTVKFCFYSEIVNFIVALFHYVSLLKKHYYWEKLSSNAYLNSSLNFFLRASNSTMKVGSLKEPSLSVKHE